MSSILPTVRPASTSGAPTVSAPVRSSSTWKRRPPPRCRPDSTTASATPAASTATPAAPTRRWSWTSVSTSALFLPEELPRVATQVAHHLLQIRVELLAREQLARRALAGAHVGDRAVDVGDEPARLVERLHRAVGGGERALHAALGHERGHAHAVVEQLVGA